VPGGPDDRLSGVARAVRWGVPLAIAAAGAVLIAVGDANEIAMGVLLVGCALLVAMASAIVRVGARSDREREAEERAREYFDAHGRWPR
jgi:hypothetical protein